MNTTSNLWQKAQARSEFYNVFSNPRRLLIVWALETREMSVGEIAETIHASLQNTSQHLHILKTQNIVASRREGQTIYYRIKDKENLEKCSILTK